MIARLPRWVALGLAACGLAACQPPPPPVVMSSKSPVELRAMQSRVYDTADRNKTVRAVLATLMDLGYTPEKTEPEAGTVTADKLHTIRLSATVVPRGDSRMVVRANALVSFAGKQTQVDDPEFYQKLFFDPLSKSLFLTALAVEDKDDVPMPSVQPIVEKAKAAAPAAAGTPAAGH